MITAGTAINEAFEIIGNEKVKLLVVSLLWIDKKLLLLIQPNLLHKLFLKKYQIPVLSIVNLGEVISILNGKINDEDLKSIEQYRSKYGA